MKESEHQLEIMNNKQLSPKDLLNVDLMKRLDKKFTEIKKLKSKEKTPDILKKLDRQDNASRLNRMGTETGKILEWGVDPDD